MLNKAIDILKKSEYQSMRKQTHSSQEAGSSPNSSPSDEEEDMFIKQPYDDEKHLETEKEHLFLPAI